MRVRYQKPEVLSGLPRTRHAVIEASAGTGKTYALEHLVVELLLGAGVGIGELLVVTFTEKATGELKARVRKLLEKLIQLGPEASAPVDVPDEACWILDDEARARLGKALLEFDTATIATIHGFCQRVLGEQAFATRRLFAETLVDGAAAFSSAFRDVLRAELARDPAARTLLAAWLQEQSVGDLEQLLYACARERGRLLPIYDPAALDAGLAAFPLDEFSALEAACANGTVRRTLRGRWDKVADAVRGALAARDPGARLLEAEALHRKSSGASCVQNLHETLGKLGCPVAARVDAALLRLDAAVVSLDAAVVGAFLPAVAARVARRKREAGLLDFDDMLLLLRDGLEGPGGEELARLLRARYRYALVDEFQDTDEVQWAIFRKVFFEGPDGVLFLIGDPKQAIYGFRGADVHAYLAARAEVRRAGGTERRIGQNFRSTAAVIEAYNRILDQNAEPPFFTGAIRYDHPVGCGNPALRLVGPQGEPVAPVHLFALRPKKNGASRDALLPPLLGRIAREIRALLDPAIGPRFDEGDGPSPLRARDIFVLTRSIDEGRQVGEVLREAGIPHAFFKQDGLFQTEEAGHVLDVLRALAAPDDRSARYRAWLTPLFGLRLEELAGARDLGSDHPLVATLDRWRALAERRDFEALFARLLDESGLIRRTVLAGNERALTNYGHLAELLLEEVARRRPTIAELGATLASWVEGRALPPGESGNVQRLESERDAVQIMTLHKSKGLEAKVVFLAGGFRSPNARGLTVCHDEAGRRTAWIDSPPPEQQEVAAREAAEEDQRLLYVGLTRAKARLYLPYVPYDGEDGQPGVGRRLDGCYGAVNARLEALVASGQLQGEAGPLFQVEVVRDADPTDDPAARGRALAAFVPRPELVEDLRDDSFARLRRERGGLLITSYSRLAGHSHLPVRGDETADLDRDEAASPHPVDDELPGGTGTGNFLHEVLEAVPLESIRDVPDAAAWAALPEIDRLLRRAARRHELADRHLPRAAVLVHGALASPLGPDLPAVAAIPRVRRELEFLYPIPEVGHPLLSRPERLPGPLDVHRGFVKGFIDLVFEHRGRVYFADWKSDLLPAYGAGALAAHVEERYDVQARLYSLAIVKHLGIRNEAEFEARFGGLLYVFLRGLAGGADGRYFSRPAFATVARWEAELAARRDLGPGGAA